MYNEDSRKVLNELNKKELVEIIIRIDREKRHLENKKNTKNLNSFYEELIKEVEK